MQSESYWDSLRRRRTRRGVLRVAAVGALGTATGAAFLGCTSGAAVPAAGPTAPPAPAAAQPKYGGTLRFAAVGEAAHQDVHSLAQLLLHGSGPGIVYSRLLKYQAGPRREGLKNIPTGDLAERWEQADELTWIFRLRPGVRWQNIPPLNGRELVAEDIAYTINRQRELRTTATYLPAMEKVEVVDRGTLRIVQPKPDADFLAILASPFNKVVAKEAVDQNGDLRDGPAVGTGPWILERWERNTTADFVRNPDYFLKGLPYAERLEIPRVTDDQTRLSALRTKSIYESTASAVRSELERINRENPDLVLTTFTNYSSGHELAFNVTRPPFNDRRVRQAVSKAIDRQAIIDSVFEGNGRWLVKLPLPDPDWILPEAEVKKAYARDVEGARRLLAEAGFPNGLDVQLTSLNLGNTFTAPGELIQQNLKDVGVNATIKLVDAPTWNVNISVRGEHQFASGQATPTSAVNLELFSKFHSEGGRNPAQLKDRRLDEMIERQAVMVRDPDGRRRLLQDIQRYILDEVPYAFICTFVSTSGVWNFLKDYSIGMPSGETDQYLYAWLDK